MLKYFCNMGAHSPNELVVLEIPEGLFGNFKPKTLTGLKVVVQGDGAKFEKTFGSCPVCNFPQLYLADDESSDSSVPVKNTLSLI